MAQLLKLLYQLPAEYTVNKMIYFIVVGISFKCF